MKKEDRKSRDSVPLTEIHEHAKDAILPLRNRVVREIVIPKFRKISDTAK
jgi:hypothetical protein